jgi:hypothetical protein
MGTPGGSEEVAVRRHAGGIKKEMAVAELTKAAMLHRPLPISTIDSGIGLDEEVPRGHCTLPIRHLRDRKLCGTESLLLQVPEYPKQPLGHGILAADHVWKIFPLAYRRFERRRDAAWQLAVASRTLQNHIEIQARVKQQRKTLSAPL